MTSSLRTFKAAVVQAAPVFLDQDGTIDKGISLIRDAAKAGAQIVAFPEAWIPGYPWWIWLGNRTPFRDPNLSGAIWGSRLHHARGHVYRAILEAVGYSTKNVLKIFRDMEIRI